MPTEIEAELLSQCTQEFQALFEDRQPVMLELSKIEAWCLLAQIQLALRHPRNTGGTTALVMLIAQRLQGYVAATPALAEMARRGWDPQYDVALGVYPGPSR